MVIAFHGLNGRRLTLTNDTAALGARAGEAAIRDVVPGAGSGTFRRAAETPFNLVYQARP